MCVWVLFFKNEWKLLLQLLYYYGYCTIRDEHCLLYCCLLLLVLSANTGAAYEEKPRLMDFVWREEKRTLCVVMSSRLFAPNSGGKRIENEPALDDATRWRE